MQEPQVPLVPDESHAVGTRMEDIPEAEEELGEDIQMDQTVPEDIHKAFLTLGGTFPVALLEVASPVVASPEVAYPVVAFPVEVFPAGSYQDKIHFEIEE